MRQLILVFNQNPGSNPAGVLYIVATPIGNLDDLSLRALEVLRNVDIIAAEDTRHSKQLLTAHNISASLISCHDYNEEGRAANFIKKLSSGVNIALISDAGTPLISDPGYRLVKAAHKQGVKVVPVPGACAAIAALSAAGLASDKFTFEGFLPSKSLTRIHQLQTLAFEPRTMIFYEAPHRVLASLQDMVEIFGEQRPVTLARELTKKFETIRLDTLLSLAEWVGEDSDQQRGEIVLVVSGFEKTNDDDLSVEEKKTMGVLLAELPLSQAASIGAKLLGTNKKMLYNYGLSKKNDVPK